MRHLNVGGTTYDTVGEASVTQVLSSGTKIATVSIDGTSTDLYAPAGGSSVDPATAAPSMDGTAVVGSSVKYAREDHVHPHDTSRLSGVILNTSSEPYDVPVANSSATIYIGDGLSVSDSNDRITLKARTGTTSDTVAAGNHTHSGYQATLVSGTNIKTVNSESLLGSGNIAVQSTLVSGTNIKTVNNESLLGSGNISTPTYTLPTASTSTLGGVKVDGSTITISDGVISSAGGGGFSKLTLYTDGKMTNLWVDSARTETLLEHYGYDLYAARDDFLSSDIIVVIYAGHMFSVLGWEIDTVDEDFYVKVFDGTVSGKLVDNGTTITFAKAKVIYVS